MKVRLLVSRAGPAGAFSRGEIIDVDAAEAESIVAAGHAEFVREEAVERAVRKPRTEKAVR